jgi:hypothetical protein
MKHLELFIKTNGILPIEVNAISIKKIKGITFFLYKNSSGFYTVSEYSTGRALVKDFSTPLGAWNAARWKIESWNHSLSLEETIKKRIKMEGAVNK